MDWDWMDFRLSMGKFEMLGVLLMLEREALLDELRLE